MNAAPFAITMGDASGVGPEIALRCAAAGLLGDDVVVYGDAEVLRAGAALLECAVTIVEGRDGRAPDGPRDSSATAELRVVDLGLLRAGDLRPGRLDAASGAAARAYVEAATRDALSGRVAGLVTLPMNKEATQLTDPSFVGHTEMIAELCGTDRVTMMLTDGRLGVTHVSTHCSLREAIERVTTERVLEVVRLTHDVLSAWTPQPRIAVCGLNPHAGENGLFGVEDARFIAPAITTARGEGIDATGPHPADTVFHQAVHRQRYDGIVCMYHDQGHAPMKLLAFDTGVNVSVGLPIIRTSVDHGTAFDIAWTGTAVIDSLVHALGVARRLAGRSHG